MRLTAGLAMTSLMPLLDAITYQVTRQHDADLGMQRLPMLVGVAVLPVASSYFVDLAMQQANNGGEGRPDFSPAFIMFIIALSVCLVVGYFTGRPSIAAQRPAGMVLRNARKLLANPAVAAFVTVMFFTGAMWGFLEKYVSQKQRRKTYHHIATRIDEHLQLRTEICRKSRRYLFLQLFIRFHG